METPSPTGLLSGLDLRELVLPFARRTISLLLVRDPLALVREDRPDLEVYWAELWPAGIALAEMLLEGGLALPSGGEPILELGCGVGLVSVAAALAGGPETRLLATDCEPRALALTALNAERNGVGQQIETRQLDWRAPYPQHHRLILCADCLYVPDSPWEIARFVSRALAPDPPGAARALVVDPERWSARHFLLAAQEAGLRTRAYRRPVPFMDRQGPVSALPVSGPPSDAEIREGMAIEAVFYELSRG